MLRNSTLLYQERPQSHLTEVVLNAHVAELRSLYQSEARMQRKRLVLVKPVTHLDPQDFQLAFTRWIYFGPDGRFHRIELVNVYLKNLHGFRVVVH